MATPNKSRVRAEAKKSSALDSNNSVTQCEASFKCKNWIDEHPDKVLHLYGMMSLGLCDPKTGAGSSTDLATSTKAAGGTRNIPHSKTTLGAVSFSHFRAAMLVLEPKSERWMDDQFGMELAPELFFFATNTNPGMRVHEHEWSKFIIFYKVRYEALGKKLSGVEVDASLTTFPWHTVGWFTIDPPAGDDGRVPSVRLTGTDEVCPVTEGAVVKLDWKLVSNWSFAEAELVSPNKLQKLNMLTMFAAADDLEAPIAPFDMKKITTDLWEEAVLAEVPMSEEGMMKVLMSKAMKGNQNVKRPTLPIDKPNEKKRRSF